MTNEPLIARGRFAPIEIVALQFAVLVFLAMRIYFDLKVDLTSDEAYYWIWGQRPGWSYFDHPPLNAWLLGIAASIGGWHPLTARAMTWLTLGGVMLIFRDWSRRLVPQDPSLWFWRTAALYLGSPVFFVFTTPAFHDHLLVFLSLLATHLFVVFTQSAENNEPGATRWLYCASIALGLAVLTKYNGLFVGFGFAGAFLVNPTLRQRLRTPHPWLAALTAVAMQAPVFYWNIAEGFASYRFHLEDRWGQNAGAFDLSRPAIFLGFTVLTFSPFLIWPMARFLRAPARSGFEASVKTVAVATFLASTTVLIIVSAFLNAFFYWNIVALVAVLPLVTRFTNVWLRAGHIFYGLAVGSAALWNFSGLPISSYDRISAVNYDWATIVTHVRAAEAANPTDMIGGTRLSTTSQLGFALRSTDVVELSADHTQYDYWQEPATWSGRSALVLVDQAADRSELEWLRRHFSSIQMVDEFPIIQLGHQIYRWRIYRCAGFVP